MYRVGQRDRDTSREVSDETRFRVCLGSGPEGLNKEGWYRR